MGQLKMVSLEVPSLASSSALSLPRKPVWAAIQRSSSLFLVPRVLSAS
jgi:hypothetical protein